MFSFAFFSVFYFTFSGSNGNRIKEYSLKYLIQENEPIGRMVGTIATDIEGAGFISTMHGSLTFKFGGSNCCFHINPKTSVLSIDKNIDLESICMNRELSFDCSTGQGNLELIVNLWSSVQLLGVVRVRISILDINDNIPKFSKSKIQRHVSEASHKAGHIIFLETAIDSDIAPENARIEYGLSEHNPVFQLRVDQLGQPYLLLLHDLDAEIQTHYQLIVRAWNLQDHKIWSELIIDIFVLDFNDNTPKFNSTTLSVMVKENIKTPTAIYQLIATDPDSSSVLRFDLYQPASPEVRTLFSVCQNGTVILMNPGLDYERLQRYQVPVKVTDGLYDSRAVLEVLVEDENDEKPQFVQNPSVIEVVENGGSGLLIGQIIISDKDGPHTNGEIICQHQATQAGLEFLQSSSKNVKNLVYDIRTEISFDREKLSEVLVVLVCSDGWNSSSSKHLTSSFTITVNILDENDNPPQFPQLQYNVNIREDSPVGTTVLETSADDLDAGINRKIAYSFKKDSSVFHIDPSTGMITVQSSLDRESKDKYKLVVLATDKGIVALSSSVIIIIIIDDANDNTPCLVPPFEFTILENSGPQLIGRLRHEDGDIGPNSEVTYSKLWPADEVITISDNGTLFATISLDRETKGRHCLRVRLRDNGLTDRRQSSGEICIKVEDVNDNKPRLTNPRGLREFDDITTPAVSQFTSLSIYESPGYLITQLVAIDDDEAMNAHIVYQIQLSDPLPPTIFTLNSSSGCIYLAKRLSHKYLGQYQIKAIATDSGSPPLSDEKIFYLHITSKPPKESDRIKINLDGSWMDRNSLFVVIILSCISLSFIAMLVTAIMCMLKPCYQRYHQHYDKEWFRKLSPGRQTTLKITNTQENLTGSLQENLLVNGSSDISSSFLNTCAESNIDPKAYMSIENQIYTENDYLGYMPNSTLSRCHAHHMGTGKNMVSRIDYGVCSQCPVISGYGSHAYATFGHYIDINNDEEIKEDFQSDSGRGASEDDTCRSNMGRLKLAGQTSTFKDCSNENGNANIPMATFSARSESTSNNLCQPTSSSKFVKPEVICDEINHLFFRNLIKS